MKSLLKLANLVLLFGVSAATFAFDCPQMPAPVGINQDVKSEIDASVGKIAGLKAGELSIKTEVTAKNLYEKYPDIEQLTIAQAMFATYCSMLKGSKISDIEKLDRWERFQSNVLKFTPPPPIGSEGAAKKTSDYLLRIKFGEEFSKLPDDVTLAVKENKKQAVFYHQQLFGKKFKIVQNLKNDLTSTAHMSSVSTGELKADFSGYVGESGQNIWNRCDTDSFNSYVTKISRELGTPKATAPNQKTIKGVGNNLTLEKYERSAYWSLVDKSRLFLHFKYSNYVEQYSSGGKNNKKWICRIELCAMQSTPEEPCFEMPGIMIAH